MPLREAFPTISQRPEVGKVYTVTQIGHTYNRLDGKTIFVFSCLGPHPEHKFLTFYFLCEEKRDFASFYLLEKGDPRVTTFLKEPNELEDNGEVEFRDKWEEVEDEHEERGEN